jgi:hypothetical protein
LHDISQTFTDVTALKVMNMCQIVTIYLNENKNYGQKPVVTVEPGTGSTKHILTDGYKENNIWRCGPTAMTSTQNFSKTKMGECRKQIKCQYLKIHRVFPDFGDFKQIPGYFTVQEENYDIPGAFPDFREAWEPC